MADSPKPALRHIDDALEGKVVGALRYDAEKGHRIADFQPLVKARAADDAVVQADLDEAVLEGAGLEGCAHEDRHVVEVVLLALRLLDLLADGARLLVAVPGGMDVDLSVLGIVAVGEKRLAEAAFIVGDEVGGGAEDVGGGAVVALQPDDGRARKILVEAQDVVDLRPAPAIDRLVVVADAADVDFCVFSLTGRSAPAGAGPPRGPRIGSDARSGLRPSAEERSSFSPFTGRRWSEGPDEGREPHFCRCRAAPHLPAGILSP